MALTQFGKHVRKLRIDRDMLLKDMSDALSVTPTFLSAVEAGRKAVPPTWLGKIAEILSLSPSESRALREAADASVREVRIALSQDAPTLNRSVAAMLARSFGELDEERMKALRDLLERRKA